MEQLLALLAALYMLLTVGEIDESGLKVQIQDKEEVYVEEREELNAYKEEKQRKYNEFLQMNYEVPEYTPIIQSYNQKLYFCVDELTVYSINE